MSEKEEKALTPKFWAISIILTALFAAWSTFQSGFMMYGGLMFSMGQNVVGMPTGALLLLGLFFLLTRVVPELTRISRKQILVFYSMIAVSLAHAGYFVPWCYYNGMIGIRTYITDWDAHIPTFWAPPKEAVEPMYLGGLPVDWGSWIVPMIFWSAFFMTLTVFALSIVSILSRRLVIEQRLPFPFGEIAANTVIYSLATEEQKRQQIKLFSIGMVLVFLYYVPWWLHLGWPSIPDIYGWYSPPFGGFFPGQINLENLGGALPCARISFPFAPFLWAWFYLLSMDILLTATLTWLLFYVILPPIAYSLGLFGVGVEPTWRATVWKLWKPGAICYLGFWPAFAIVPLIIGYKYIGRTIRAAIKGEPAGPNDLMSYRMAYILLIVSGVAILAFYMVSGGGFITSIWGILYIIISLLAFANLRGEAGMLICAHGFCGWFQPLWRHVLATGDVSLAVAQGPNYSVPIYLTYMTTSDIHYGTVGGKLAYGLDALKLADRLEQDLRGVFPAMIIGSLVAIIVSTPIVLWSYYTIGFPRVPIHGDGIWWPNQLWPSSMNSSPSPFEPGGHGPYAAFGFGLVTLLYLLRLKFAWFPLHPVGLYLGGIGPWFPTGAAAPIALILKYLTFKIGGTKLYEEKGVPLAVGAFIGFTLFLLVGGLISIWRTFVPA
ncbi:hypothetical protein DRO64_03665 [Candidatus Bathyarchaeota archaeon]|nr:MAG: hypothetical protein DRO64_03665 [Candidatus Bathyarchaeota archaeon]